MRDNKRSRLYTQNTDNNIILILHLFTKKNNPDQYIFFFSKSHTTWWSTNDATQEKSHTPVLHVAWSLLSLGHTVNTCAFTPDSSRSPVTSVSPAFHVDTAWPFTSERVCVLWCVCVCVSVCVCACVCVFVGVCASCICVYETIISTSCPPQWPRWK